MNKKPDSKQWFSVRNAAKGVVEVLIYDQIGKDYWSDEGVGAKDFAEALKEIPATSNILVRINSPGGNMWDGLAISALLKQRGDKVTCCVDGIAASIASIIAISGSQCQMAANSLLMIHNPTALCMGEADDMREMADMLDKHRDVLANAYQSKSGKAVADIVQAMDSETWMTPQEAKDFGLCDVINDEVVTTASASNFDLSVFRRVPASLRGQQAPDNKGTGLHIMNRTQILALLKKWGVTVSDTATDTELNALVEKGPPIAAAVTTPVQPTAQAHAPTNATDDLAKQVDELRRANAAERRMRLGKEIDALVAEERIPVNQREEWLNRVVADEGVLASLKMLPKPQRQEPVGISIETVDPDVKNIVAGIKELNAENESWHRGNSVSWRRVANAAVERGNRIHKHIGKLEQVYNANTIDAALQRQVILQMAIFDFVRRLTPLRQFANVLSPVPLEGTDKIEIPYYNLDTTAATDWVAGTGYVAGNTASDKIEVTINKRKYLGASFTSTEIARQPFLSVKSLMSLKAQKLASDVWTDVLSSVTLANYGAAAFTGLAATFDSNALATMKLACKTWPADGRSLFLDSAYDANLLKDAAFKYALNAASDSAVKEGRLYPRVFGFDYIENPNIPGNGQNLVGFAAFQSALAFGQAPIPPTEEVRRAGTMYDMVIDPQTGAVFEYRSFGSNNLDSTNTFVECNYGYAKGNSGAIKRIVSA